MVCQSRTSGDHSAAAWLVYVNSKLLVKETKIETCKKWWFLYRRATRYLRPSFSSSAITQSVMYGVPEQCRLLTKINNNMRWRQMLHKYKNLHKAWSNCQNWRRTAMYSQHLAALLYKSITKHSTCYSGSVCPSHSHTVSQLFVRYSVTHRYFLTLPLC